MRGADAGVLCGAARRPVEWRFGLPSRRGTEVVVPGSPRKRFVAKAARGFESHPLRQPSPIARSARGSGWQANRQSSAGEGWEVHHRQLWLSGSDYPANHLREPAIRDQSHTSWPERCSFRVVQATPKRCVYVLRSTVSHRRYVGLHLTWKNGWRRTTPVRTGRHRSASHGSLL